MTQQTETQDTKAESNTSKRIVGVVIGLIAWGVLRLMTPHTGTRVERTETTGHDVQEK
jgi:hypothetical protein